MLAQGLVSNMSLVRLNLRRNRIGAPGANALVQVLNDRSEKYYGCMLVSPASLHCACVRMVGGGGGGEEDGGDDQPRGPGVMDRVGGPLLRVQLE